jgi:hypothetical protein
LVFITEMKSVYSAVRTGDLNEALCSPSLKANKEALMVRTVQRMVEGRLPKGVLEWRPAGGRKRGRPKLTWAEGIRGVMGEKGLQKEDWADRNNWRRKIA